MKCGNKCKTPKRYTQTAFIQRIKDSAGDANGEIDLTSDSNWEQVYRIKVSVKTRRGREINSQGQREAHRITTLLTPYRSDVSTATPDMRIVLNGRKLNIEYVQNVDEEFDEIEIGCTENVR